MQIPTHILSGWCVGASLPVGPRERLACMLVASLPDLDGFGRFVSQEMYEQWHHVLGHNLAYGLLLALACTGLVRREWRVRFFPLLLGLFHVHLVMDYYGSGPGWGLAYWWPFSDLMWEYKDAWSHIGWQNYVVLGALMVWAGGIALWKGCTPFELLTPGLESDWRRLRERWSRREVPVT